MLKDQEPQTAFTTRIVSENDTSITLEISHAAEIVLFTYTPPGKVVFEFNPALQEQQEPTPEEPKPVKLRGRIGTKIHEKDSPTGGKMAVFSFGEHPDRAVWSYSNTLEKKPEKDTVWWRVAAFDENISLLAGVVKGNEYDITCFPRSWKELADGKEKTIDGLYLVGLQPVVRRTNKQPPQ